MLRSSAARNKDGGAGNRREQKQQQQQQQQQKGRRHRTVRQLLGRSSPSLPAAVVAVEYEEQEQHVQQQQQQVAAVANPVAGVVQSPPPPPPERELRERDRRAVTTPTRISVVVVADDERERRQEYHHCYEEEGDDADQDSFNELLRGTEGGNGGNRRQKNRGNSNNDGRYDRENRENVLDDRVLDGGAGRKKSSRGEGERQRRRRTPNCRISDAESDGYSDDDNNISGGSSDGAGSRRSYDSRSSSSSSSSSRGSESSYSFTDDDGGDSTTYYNDVTTATYNDESTLMDTTFASAAADHRAVPPKKTKLATSSSRRILDNEEEEDDDEEEEATGVYESAVTRPDLADMIERVVTKTFSSANDDEDDDVSSTETPSSTGSSGCSSRDGNSNSNNKAKNDRKDKDSAKERQERLNAICYRLATNDAGLTALLLDFRKVDGDRAVKEISELLPQNGYVTEVCVRNADLAKETSGAIGAAVKASSAVQRFGLKDCTFADESSFACLMMAIQHCPKLDALDVANCRLSEIETDMVSASIPLMKLKTLSLVNTGVGYDHGLQFLSHNIEQSPDLTDLNLSRNPGLGRPEAVKMLAGSLYSKPGGRRKGGARVTKLDLSSCGLDDPGVKVLAKEILENPVLATLNLSNNVLVGDQGAVYLKHLLRKNHAIKNLHVDGCHKITKKRRKAIDDGIRYNNSFLQKLGLSETPVLAILESIDFIENLGATVSNTGATATTAAATRINSCRSPTLGYRKPKPVVVSP